MNTESNPYLLINCVATIGVCVFRGEASIEVTPFLLGGKYEKSTAYPLYHTILVFVSCV